MNEHSPTPWRVSCGYIVFDADGVSIASAFRCPDAALIVEAVNQLTAHGESAPMPSARGAELSSASRPTGAGHPRAVTAGETASMLLPWTVEGPFPGQRATKKRDGFAAYANIVNRVGAYVAQGLPPEVAAGIVEAVNERALIRKAFEDISEFAAGMTSEEDEANAFTILDICAKALEAHGNPTPWKAVKHNPVNVTIEDAAGVAVATAHQFPPYCESMETAQRIVEAVNELDKLNDVAVNLQRSRDAALADAERLRDIVRRLAEYIRHSCYDCGGSWEIDIKSSDPSYDYHGNADELLREAREAIGEDAP